MPRLATLPVLLVLAAGLSFAAPRVATAQADASPQTRTVAARAELRAAPRADAAVVATLPRGARVESWTCIIARGAWCAVTAGNRPGYVRADALAGATGQRRGRASSAAPSSAPASGALPLSSARPQQSGGPASGYYRGPRGGCYTLTASGRKKYVDRSLCGG